MSKFNVYLLYIYVVYDVCLVFISAKNVENILT